MKLFLHTTTAAIGLTLLASSASACGGNQCGEPTGGGDHTTYDVTDRVSGHLVARTDGDYFSVAEIIGGYGEGYADGMSMSVTDAVQRFSRDENGCPDGCDSYSLYQYAYASDWQSANNHVYAVSGDDGVVGVVGATSTRSKTGIVSDVTRTRTASGAGM